MTAVSLISPYAPQPAQGTASDSVAAATTVQPLAASSKGREAGTSSDQSGFGAGNGTGTGGAHLESLLKRGREGIPPIDASPKSVVEAQAKNDLAREFLDRQARQQIEAKATEEARVAERATAKAAAAQAEATAAAQPEYVMPNPLPTAPILQDDNA